MSIKEPPAMAKDKATKTSSKKNDTTKEKKAKRQKSSKAIASGLSDERVVDSDSEEETTTAEPTPAKKTKEAPKEQKGGKKQSAKKTKPAAPPPPPESEASSSEADSDGSMPDIPLKKPEGVPGKVNGVKRKADEPNSDESSSGNEGEEETEKPQAKKAKTAPVGTSDSDSSSEEKSDSEDLEERQAAKASAVGAPKDKQPTTTTKQISSVNSIPAQPYEPPFGYVSIDVSSPASTSAFGNISGKQVWHITAPSNVSIKDITQVGLDAIASSKPVLSHKGIEYILNEDSGYDTQSTNVLLPSQAGYQHAGQKIEKTLRLQQKIQLPNLTRKQADPNTGSDAAADIAQAPVSEIRPQPKGLKMRYKPPGFGKGDPGRIGSGSSDGEESGTTRSTLQFPESLGANAPTTEPENAITEKSKKKDKKKRKSESLIDGDVDMVNGRVEMPLPSEKKKKKKHGQVDGLERVVSKESERAVSKVVETPEERARRKELKRLKKETKKRAKEGEGG